MRQALASLALGLACAALSGAACAQESPAPPAPGAFHLSWVRSAEADGCPDASRVMADVAARLGSSPFTTQTPLQGTIEVQVSRERGSWFATISMRDQADAPLGSRRVQSGAESCDSLASAAVLAIALMIQPSLDPSPERPPPKPNATKEPSAAAAQPPSQPVAPSSVTPFVAAGSSTIAGALPEVSFGPTLHAGLHFDSRFVLQAGAHFFPQQWTTAAAMRTGFGLSLGSLNACLRFPIGSSFALSSCGVMLVGAMHVAVDAPEPVKPGDGLWLGAGCGLGLALRAGPVDFALSASAVGHFQRRDYRVERSGQASASVFVEPGLAALSSLTVGTRL